MQKSHVLKRILITLLTLTIVTGFVHFQASALKPRPPKHTKITEANNAFGFSLYKRLLQNPKNRSKNLFFSPHSIHTALAMSLEGARGKTGKEMNQILGFAGNKQARQNFRYFLWALAARGKTSTSKFHTANRLWGQKGKAFLKSYLQNLKSNYSSSVHRLDFKTKASTATKRINAWVAKKTNNRIKKLISGVLPSDTRMVLTNAVYFKDSWEIKFKKKNTRPRKFYLNRKKHIKVPTMRVKENFKYSSNSEAQILEMPYSSSYSMVVLLPKQGKLSQLEANLTNKKLKHWLSRSYKTKLTVYLPKFKTKSGMLLKSVLSQMGMPTAFGNKADFSGIDGTKGTNGLRISEIIHKSFVKVDEEGAEAAAATAIYKRAGRAVSPTFRANRPFVYLIRDTYTGAIVFMGRMVNPKG